MTFRISATDLHQQVIEILQSWGVPEEYAATTAEILVDTDLHGIDSHGVAMLVTYSKWQKERQAFQFDAAIEVVRDMPAIALLDAGHGLGHSAAKYAMQLAIEKCRKTGIALVNVRNSNHYGAAGYYARMAAAQGYIGISTTGTPGAAVAPTFGRKAMFGTNPIAFAAPAKNNKPFVLDMATATVAIGKLAIADRSGKKIPEGWALDADGLPTTDASIARQARLLTPLGGDREHGGHKGYGLAVMIDILASTLSGADIPAVENHFGRSCHYFNIGHSMIVIDPDVVGENDFGAAMDELIDALHGCDAAVDGQAVRVAGDPEWEAFADRSKNGIPLSDKVVSDLAAVSLIDTSSQ